MIGLASLVQRPTTGRAAPAARPACRWLAIAFAVVAALTALGCSRSSTSSSVEIQWNAALGRFEVLYLPSDLVTSLAKTNLSVEQWNRLFSVYTADSILIQPINGTSQPLLGAYSVDGAMLVFAPRFPLRPGVGYMAHVTIANRGRGDEDIAVLKGFHIPDAAPPSQAPTRVDAVYPSDDRLPANLLRFYVHFSAPMSRGESYEHVRIVDAEGRAVPDAFLEIGEELWDPNGQRLTLLFDPGRIKRGVKPNEDVGAPLIEGRSYALVVDAEWRDALGHPLEAAFRKDFTVTESDDTQPNPHRWKLTSPGAGSRDALAVTFDEPLDHALAERMIVVLDDAGQLVSGDVAAATDGRSWSFTPTDPWRAAEYALHVSAELEDFAGNSVGRPFERVEASPDEAIPDIKPVDLPFRVDARQP